MKSGISRITGPVFLTVVLLILLQGHDYWFEARPYIVSPGDSVSLHLLVGDDLKPELERAFERKPTLSMVMDGKNGSMDLLPQMKEGSGIFASVKLTEPGFFQFALERDYSYITLSQSEFMEYLMHEEIADRKELLTWLQQNPTEKERYARSVKTLVAVTGEADDPGVYRKVLNHPYEIVLNDNPYKMHVGDILSVRILKNGVPAIGMKVMAQNNTGGFSEKSAVSSEDGKVSFKLDKPGIWVIRSLWLRPCRDCDTVNWESHWASYSFYLQE